MQIVPATPERWDDLAGLFTRRGPRGGMQMTAGCWCMWWRRRTGDGSRNRAGLRQLTRSPVYRPTEPEEGVWAVTCFAVAPGAKRQGAAGDLLDAAVGHAFAHGATAIEAYPHVRGDYMGVPSMFERLGFEAVRRAGPRTIVRLSA